ncbi:hypothetical protein ACJZ2D_011396 [Fusarium nematophilum]
MLAGSSGKQHIHHASAMPPRESPPDEDHANLIAAAAPCAPELLPIAIEDRNGPPQDKWLRSWIRAPAKIVQADNCEIHQAILVFLSDWIGVSVAPYAHGLFKFMESLSASVENSVLHSTPVSMLSTLGHTIYFHAPLSIRADEWMLLEANSPWSGAERGLATVRMFAKNGTLLATYVQEASPRHKNAWNSANIEQGVIRLREDSEIPIVKL